MRLSTIQSAASHHYPERWPKWMSAIAINQLTNEQGRLVDFAVDELAIHYFHANLLNPSLKKPETIKKC